MLLLFASAPTGALGAQNTRKVTHVILTVFRSMGFARLAESTIRQVKGKGENDKLSALEKIASSTIGGALATWNQPIEVVRVEVRLFTFSSTQPF